MSAQLEQQRLNQQNFFGLGADTSGQRSPIVPTTTAPSQTFADFSKESAFKKSQKASGISYEEKVASYLSDQQTNLPVINQNNQPFREQAGNQRQDQVDAASVRKSPYFEKEKPTSFAQGVKPPPSPRSEPPQRGTSSPLPRPISPSTSVTSSKRQLAPHEFLSKLQEFARNAAKDAEMAQPDGPDGPQGKPQQDRSYAPKQRDHTTAHQSRLRRRPRRIPTQVLNESFARIIFVFLIIMPLKFLPIFVLNYQRYQGLIKIPLKIDFHLKLFFAVFSRATS